MIIYIKKIKTKEGINSINLEKIAKEIPTEYLLANPKPTISYTSNHIVIAYNVKEVVVEKVAVAKKKPAAVSETKKPNAAPAKKLVSAKNK